MTLFDWLSRSCDWTLFSFYRIVAMGRIRLKLIEACHAEAVSLMRAARYSREREKEEGWGGGGGSRSEG